MTAEPEGDLLRVAPAYDLPTARQVVGRGLQLAFEASSELRRASLYVGLLLFVLAGPALIVLVADLPRLTDFPFENPADFDPQRATEFTSIFGSLTVLAIIAFVGFVAISIDGTIMAVTILAGRAVGRRVTLRHALIRARQVFWRYLFAAIVVAIIGQLASSLVNELSAAARDEASSGADLLAVFAGTIATAPFGYVAAGIILGDVDSATALRRSVTLARARPRLAAVVATFAFVAGVLQLFGIGAAADAAGRIIAFQHLSIDPTSGNVLVALPVIAAALIALGSLGLTVAAVVAAPQVVAFLGLTHYAAGLDRAQPPVAFALAPEVATVAGRDDASSSEAGDRRGCDTAPELDGGVVGHSAATAVPDPEASTSAWVRGAEPNEARFRWVTIPMLLLIAFAVFIAIAGLIAAA
ncbi:MAG TPA: hypothetical protein VEX41_03350 [Candidatus Eisenbacteria bacterium]|nr:hypothetical protein [Candidatus Eisenbacteria bacterium]